MTERTLKALEIVRLAAELGDYDSNVIGMAAEVIAEEEYGMTKAKRGQKDVDGSWLVEENNRTVQVKAWSEKRIKDYRNGTKLRLKLTNLPDDLLLLLVHSSEQKFTELYTGPALEVGKIEVLKGVQFRKVSLGQLIAALPQSAQDGINLLLKKDNLKQTAKRQNKSPSPMPLAHTPPLPMPLTHKIPGFPFTFKRVLQLTHVDGYSNDQPVVRYTDYDRELGRERNGVALVVQGDGKELYCSAFTNQAFAQAWLYARDEYLYKLPKKAAAVLEEGLPIGIYMATCENPKRAADDINDKLGPRW
ncbi:hypothetical protein [Hymenobacter sp. UYCo722]|uniref:DUF6998 domain-containing protein n=1 Tax=Hymenobacter sp. UYCo722 TaxID=3156335 RepID=UPI00339AA0E3